MSSGGGTKVSVEDIKKVQDRIEQCLSRYMSWEETVNTLFSQDKIERKFTEIVWQKLEEENQEFFQAYHLKLMVKEQIIEFNKLLEHQVKMMSQVSSGNTSLPMSNEFLISPMLQNSAFHAVGNVGSAPYPVGMHNNFPANLYTAMSYFWSSAIPGMQTAADNSSQSRNSEVPPSALFVQSSNIGMIQTMDDILVGYSGAPYLATNTADLVDPNGTGQYHGNSCCALVSGDIERSTAGRRL